LQLANNIKSKRELALHTDKHGFGNKTDSKDSNFLDYFNSIVEAKKGTSLYYICQSAFYSIKDFKGDDILFSDITIDFVEKYLRYLQNKKGNKSANIMPNTIKTYFCVFSYVIKQAIQDKIILENPILFVRLPKVKKPKIVYFTESELKKLVKTDCKHPILKRAFIFSCLTGLRWSDVYKLKWDEIVQDSNGKYSIVYRHTFAVLQLSFGTNVFTLQRLLGHQHCTFSCHKADIKP
jgi:integrase